MSASERHCLLVWAVSCLLLCQAVAAQEQKIKIAIIAFEDPAAATYGINPITGLPMTRRSSYLGREVADKLAQELSKTGEYTITERTMADRQFASIGQAAYDISQETLTQKGKALGIEYFVLGRVSVDYGEEAKEEVNWGSILTRQRSVNVVYLKNVRVAIQFRIVDALSAEVVVADEGIGSASRKEQTPGLDSTLLGLASSAAISVALDKLRGYAEALVKPPWEAAREEALSGQMARLEALKAAEGKILGEAPDGSFVVSLGSDQGLAEGETLKVMSEEVVRNKQTGEIIFSEQKERGTLIITRLQPQRSMAKPGSGGGFEVGDSVKPDVSQLEQQLSGTFKREPTVEELLERGQRFYDKRLYKQALKELERARGMLPENDPRAAKVAGMVGGSQFKSGDPDAAAASWTWAIQHGESISTPVYHGHFSGNCLGTVQVTKDGFRFQSPQADHSFETPIEGLSISFIQSHMQLSAPPLGKTKPRRWDLYLVADNGEDLANLSSALSKMLAALQKR